MPCEYFFINNNRGLKVFNSPAESDRKVKKNIRFAAYDIPTTYHSIQPTT